MDPQRSNTPSNATSYVYEVLKEPLYSAVIRPSYHLRVRPLHKPSGRTIQNGAAEVILASGEAIPVNVIGFGTVQPMPSAVKSGAWTPDDEIIFIEASDLTAEQARQVRRFVQHHDKAS